MWPDTSNRASKGATSHASNRAERLENESHLLSSECHDPLPMDISPCGSPALCHLTKSPTKSPITKAGSRLQSDDLGSPSKKTCVLETVQFPSIDLSKASPSVVSLLSKCNACMKRMLAQAKGTGVSITEPCTCSVKQEKVADPRSKPANSAVHEPHKTGSLGNDSLMNHKPKEVTLTKMTEEPLKRVVVQRVNGVARLFSVSDQFSMRQNFNVEARNTTPLQKATFTNHEGVRRPPSTELNTPEHCVKQKSSTTKYPVKTSLSLKAKKDFTENVVDPRKSASKCVKSSSTPTEPVSEHKDGRAQLGNLSVRRKKNVKHWRSLTNVSSAPSRVSPCGVRKAGTANKDGLLSQSKPVPVHGDRRTRRRRLRRKRGAKNRRILNDLPTALTDALPSHVQQGATANKDLPQSAPSPDAELSLSSALTRTMSSPEVPISAEESYEDCWQAVRTLLHVPTTRCTIDIPPDPTSQDEVTTKREQGSRASLGVCAGDGGPSTCTRDISTNDVVVGGKVMGVYYAPGPVIDRVVLTSIEMHVDPKLGGCAERLHGPLSLLSQAEKLDEGWILSFD